MKNIKQKTEKKQRFYPFNKEKIKSHITKVFKGKEKKPKLFCDVDVFTIFFNTGQHVITIDPKGKSIKKAIIDEIDEIEHIPVCGGCGNSYDYEFSRDKVIIRANVKTNIGVIKVKLL